jgi:hypothetical protein
LIGSLPLTYSSSVPKANIVFGSDSVIPTLPTLANVTTVATVSNITNFGAIPASEQIYGQQQSAYCSFLAGVVSTT